MRNVNKRQVKRKTLGEDSTDVGFRDKPLWFVDFIKCVFCKHFCVNMKTQIKTWTREQKILKLHNKVILMIV